MPSIAPKPTITNQPSQEEWSRGTAYRRTMHAPDQIIEKELAVRGLGRGR
jgi:hypothetical protein